MLKRFLVFGVLMSFALSSVPDGFGQRRRTTTRPTQAAAPAAAPASAVKQLSGPLGAYFPADTFAYVEVGDLAEVVEQIGGVGYVYNLMRQAAESVGGSGNPGKLPLTEEQFRGLLGCSFALGISIPPGSKLVSGDVQPSIAGVIRTPSAEVLETLQGFIADAAKTRPATAAKPRVTRIAGVSVTTYPDPKPDNSFSYATIGNDIVVGDTKGITAFLSGVADPRAKHLGDVPGYVTASARVPGSRVLFAYLNGGPLVKAFNDGIDASMATGGKPSPSGDFVKALVGMNAVRGGSLTAVSEGTSMAIQAAVEMDRTKPGLLSILSDPPTISSRGSALVADDTDMLYVTSFDLIRIYDFVMAIMTPERAKALGVTPGELAGYFEAKTGVKFRQEFLAALGSEVIVASSIVQTDTMTNVSIEAQAKPKVDYRFVVLFETRNPDVVTKCTSALVGSESDPIKTETIDGVDVWSNSTIAWTYIEGFCLTGEKGEVLRTLAAIKDRRTLGSTPAFAASSSTLPNNAITAMYMSPRLFELAAKEAEVDKNMPNALTAFPNGLFLSVQKDENGLYTNFSVPLPNLRLLLEKEKQTAGVVRP